MNTIPSYWVGLTLIHNESELTRDIIERGLEFCNAELNIKLNNLSIVHLHLPKPWLGVYLFQERKIRIRMDRYDEYKNFVQRYTRNILRHDSPEEFFISILAHEMRHAYQDQNGWDPYDGKKLEVDAEEYQYRKLNEWRIL